MYDETTVHMTRSVTLGISTAAVSLLVIDPRPLLEFIFIFTSFYYLLTRYRDAVDGSPW
jgi:hypothetical protein